MVRQHSYHVLHAGLLCCPLSSPLTVGGISQVQVLVHIRPADRAGKSHFELLEVETHTGILQLKQQVPRCWTTQMLMADRT